jgi:hypothetical protein
MHEKIYVPVKCQYQFFRLQESFHMDLGAGKLVTQAYTQMFITTWIGLKKTYDWRIEMVWLRKV